MDYMDFVQVRLVALTFSFNCRCFLDVGFLPGSWWANLHLLLHSVLIVNLFITRIIGKVVQISLFLVCQWMTGESGNI